MKSDWWNYSMFVDRKWKSICTKQRLQAKFRNELSLGTPHSTKGIILLFFCSHRSSCSRKTLGFFLVFNLVHIQMFGEKTSLSSSYPSSLLKGAKRLRNLLPLTSLEKREGQAIISNPTHLSHTCAEPYKFNFMEMRSCKNYHISPVGKGEKF